MSDSSHEHPIFILSAGRSGSTWLQKTLCMHPRLVIWGEHHGILDPLTAALRRMQEQERINPRIDSSKDLRAAMSGSFDDLRRQTAWAQSFDVDEFRSAMKRWILELFANSLPEGTRWGFKEIRYAQRGLADSLLELFPHARFIFLTRNTANCLRSMVISWVGRDWRAKTDEELRHYIRERFTFIAKQQASFEPFVAAHPDACHLLSYEDMLEDYNGAISKTLTFLGEDPNAISPERLQEGQQTVTWPTPDDAALIELIENTIR